MIHFHNGDVAASLARLAGVPGRHVPFRESLVGGPVQPSLPLHEWVEARALFLSEHHGEKLLRVRNELLEQELALDRAREEEEVVLWFEHDLFCLVHLLYLLSRLSKSRRITLIWSPQPLGTQSEEDLFSLFQSREALTPAMTSAAALAWRAFTSDDPTSLNRFLGADIADFPFLRDGLVLQAVPVITIIGEEKANPPKALFALTPAGRNVMAGEVDFIEINVGNGSQAGFWLGGAHLTRERMWRWDAGLDQIVPSRHAAS